MSKEAVLIEKISCELKELIGTQGSIKNQVEKIFEENKIGVTSDEDLEIRIHAMRKAKNSVFFSMPRYEDNTAKDRYEYELDLFDNQEWRDRAVLSQKLASVENREPVITSTQKSSINEKRK